MESIILNNTATLILTFAALIICVISWFVKNKPVSAILSVASFVCVLAVVTYALLLGAELNEILTVVLLFVFINLFSFVPNRERNATPSPSDSIETEENVYSCNELGTSSNPDETYNHTVKTEK